ncbi:RagB/SusD family nutrient uptake outer membrane protein [Mesonia sp.]|uniref:RagB/SusD family nutrient uptake outer membrane protein n=1 Tax=Mesonia sp. TaxID=1960830 RepID=UPI0025BB6283|nr:RagB/SusD family nutrient uptake outer membrane protein [Mesonia sp.]
MRKIYILTILSFYLISCSSELEQTPISEIGSNNFYSSEEDFENAVNGIYSTLDIYPNMQFYLSEVRSDNMYAVTQTGVRPYEQINNFDLTLATNEQVSDNWDNNFVGVFRANTVLDQLNGNVISDETTLSRIEGEAKFLRAFFYFDLVRTYGKVPLMDRVYTPVETLDLGRSSVEDVYQLILSDLQDAINLLPESYPGSQEGKATSWSAKAMLGLVYLTRSGPTYSIEGPGLNSGEYSDALSQFNDIINNGPFGFVDDYASIFSYENEGNPEIIFDIQYISGGLGAGGEYQSLTVPNGYLTVNQAGFPNGEDRKQVSTDLIEDYSEDDVREEFNILEGYTDENGNYLPSPFYVKYIDLQFAGQDRFDWGLNYPVIRYTDILMMKAEAILMGGSGSQADILNDVNMIRDRAGLAPIASVDIDILLEEKRREFACESKRWYDLIRTGKVIETINSWVPEEDVQDRMNTMDENQIIYPVPTDQMTVKEGLYEQNPGYN